MLVCGRKAAQLTLLCLVWNVALSAGERPGTWSGNYLPCNQHYELLSQEHKNLGVRFSTSSRGLAPQFMHALDFWSTILDMDWYEEDSRGCSIAIIDGHDNLFRPAEVARAQFPDSPTFQGWIAFNRKIKLPRHEQYLTAVHEIGHLLGLRHNPNAHSVMFYLRLDGQLLLDANDLSALAARHKLRLTNLERALIVPMPKPRTKEISSRSRSPLGARWEVKPPE